VTSVGEDRRARLWDGRGRVLMGMEEVPRYRRRWWSLGRDGDADRRDHASIMAVPRADPVPARTLSAGDRPAREAQQVSRRGDDGPSCRAGGRTRPAQRRDGGVERPCELPLEGKTAPGRYGASRRTRRRCALERLQDWSRVSRDAVAETGSGMCGRSWSGRGEADLRYRAGGECSCHGRRRATGPRWPINPARHDRPRGTNGRRARRG